MEENFTSVNEKGLPKLWEHPHRSNFSYIAKNYSTVYI
jgi:hypothetical protein